MQNQRGFTLLELLLSLVILATLTAASSRSIQQALAAKLKIQTQLDEMSQVRDALKLMERDVNLAFHYRDLEMEFRDAVKKAGQPGAGAAGAGTGINRATGLPIQQAGGPATPTTQSPDDILRRQNRVDPVTQFLGTNEDMSFMTLNSGRVGENEAHSEVLKIGYAVKPCKRLSGKQEETKCLLRRADFNAEGDVTKGGDETVLLENISEFKVRYFGKGKQDWVNDWNSKESGDAAVKNNYPSAVEISMTVENGDGPKKRKISMQIVAQVRFPNNAATSGNPNQLPTGTQTTNPGAPDQGQGGSAPSGSGF